MLKLLSLRMVRGLACLGFISAACICLPVSRAQQVAFTWDDLPAHSSLPPGDTRAGIILRIIGGMKAAHMPPVYGFVNGVHVVEEPASAEALQDWENAGLPIGNHTWSHINLNAHTAAEWEADVLRNESTLEKYSGGRSTKWLRYPYLAEGDTPAKRDAVRAFLADHQYKIAAVTMSFGDYAFNEPYARCVAKNDSKGIEDLETAYLAAADAEITYRRAVAKAIFGHDIPYVLLMHVGALDAQMITKLLALYRDRGFSFVTLEQAEADPFYANDLDLSLPSTPDTLEGLARKQNIVLPPAPRIPINLDTVCR